MSTPTKQSDIPLPSYRSSFKTPSRGAAASAFSEPAKDYTPGISEAPQGNAAMVARYTWKTTQKHL